MLEQAVIDLTAEVMLLRETLQEQSQKSAQQATPPKPFEEQQPVWLTPAKFAKTVGLKPVTIAAHRKEGKFRQSSFKFMKRGHLGVFLYHRIEAAKDLGRS